MTPSEPHPAAAADPAPVDVTRLTVGAEARFHGSLCERADLEIIEALGLTVQSRLRVCQAGDPWIIQVRSTRIGLAEAVARRILVIPEAGR